jgi:hypothetical protein
MSKIVIKDLPESVELDREAMRAVVGGAAPRLGMVSSPRSCFFAAPLSFETPKILPSPLDMGGLLLGQP